MFKKLLLVAILSFFMMASSAYAFVAGENGTQNIETVFVTDMGDLVSGDIVILQTTSPTYPGREVTGTTTAGLPIFGVVLGDPEATACAAGTWIRIQTYGYCPIIKCQTTTPLLGITAGQHLYTSNRMFEAASSGSATVGVTGNIVIMEALGSSASTGLTDTICAGYIGK